MKIFMLKRIIFVPLLFGSVSFGKPQRGEQSKKGTVLQEKIVWDTLNENMESMRGDINNLADTVHSLKMDMEALRLNSKSFNETQRAQAKEIAGEAIGENAKIIDQNINDLSSAFSKVINELSEKLQNALNRIIAVLNAQQKLSSTVAETKTKQPNGIAHEVREGETLIGIAIKYNTAVESIKNINFIIDENHLPPGLMLLIPRTK
ncbi:MAG: LysM peptidoglycan-binding domain-containing protein [Puniceicoccales bacterium]|nr:LysM peptidoglycan-binding domain-containing protein [Puniceicoccales bacterium]